MLTLCSGTVSTRQIPHSKDRDDAQSWTATKASCALNAHEYLCDDTILWTPCSYLVSSSTDRCTVASWVIAQSPLVRMSASSVYISPYEVTKDLSATALVIGRVTEIICRTDSSSALATIDVFELASARHAVYDMPKLYRQDDEPRHLIIPVSVSSFHSSFEW